MVSLLELNTFDTLKVRNQRNKEVVEVINDSES